MNMDGLARPSMRLLASSRPFIRHVAADESSITLPRRTQIRGAKHQRESKASHIRLLRDVPKFGREGTVMAVPIGMMRNMLYPAGNAAYIPPLEVRELKEAGSVMERDRQFGVVDKKARRAQAPYKEIEIRYKPETRQVDLTKLEVRLT